MLLLLALLCFIVAAVWAAVTRSWPVLFVAAGLALLAANDMPIVVED